MNYVVPLPSFERCIHKMTVPDRQRIAEALERFNQFQSTGTIAAGLGLKKINHDKYELRVDIRLRVVMKKVVNEFHLVFVGSHDDVRKYLRQFRHK